LAERTGRGWEWGWEWGWGLAEVMKYGGSRTGRGRWVGGVGIIKGGAEGSRGSSSSSESASAYATNKSFIII